MNLLHQRIKRIFNENAKKVYLCRNSILARELQKMESEQKNESTKPKRNRFSTRKLLLVAGITLILDSRIRICFEQKLFSPIINMNPLSPLTSTLAILFLLRVKTCLLIKRQMGLQQTLTRPQISSEPLLFQYNATKQPS